MRELNRKNKEPKEERRFSQKQYEMLKRCSEKKDMTEWNEWRKNNPAEDVLLEGARLEEFHLERAHFGPETVALPDILKTEGKKTSFVDLSWAQLQSAHLEGAYLQLAQLRGASLHNAHLDGADLRYAHLKHASLCEAHLEGAIFERTDLRDTSFRLAIVNGSTLIWGCRVDRSTDFDGVALYSVRIDPATKQLLEYNIRRMNWEAWYKKGRFWHWLIRIFWRISNYGIDATRVVKVFFVLAMLFAIVYYVCGALDYYFLDIKDHPGIVSNLFVDSEGIPVYWWLVPLRSIYFSIVTMTTLGFGDMYADAQNYWWSWLGHLLLVIQVGLGYVLLGALVTRFAVLFMAGGPAGEFADGRKEKTAEDTEGKSQ